MLNNSVIYRNGSFGRGSVGGFFRFHGASDIYGISNNHVIANINNCNIGDPIFDESGSTIGALTHWRILNGANGFNLVDVALFKYNGAAGPPAWRIGAGLTHPKGFIEPLKNGRVYMPLEQGVRQGWISNAHTDLYMDFLLCGQHFAFTHLIEIKSLNGSPFSEPGDSGSVVLSSNHYIVGLILGTSKDTTTSYAIPFVEGILNYYPLIL